MISATIFEILGSVFSEKLLTFRAHDQGVVFTLRWLQDMIAYVHVM